MVMAMADNYLDPWAWRSDMNAPQPQPNYLAPTLKPGPEPTGYEKVFDTVYNYLGGKPENRRWAEKIATAFDVATLGMATGAYDGGKDLAKTGRPNALAMALMPGAKLGKAAAATAKAAEVIGDDAIRALYKSRSSLPDGWFVHGRNGTDKLRDDAVIMGTRDYDVMDQYAGSHGSGWAFTPRGDTTVLNLSGDTRDSRKIAQAMMADYRSGMLPPDMEAMLPSTPKVADFYSAASEFSPKSIVDSGGAFDSIPMVNWLYDKTNVGVALTPNGAVAMHPEAVRAVRLYQTAGPLAGAGLGAGALWPRGDGQQ